MFVESKFRYWVILPIMLALLSAFLFVFLPISLWAECKELSMLAAVLFLLALLFFVFAWAVFGELRNKVVRTIMDNQAITIKRYLALGPSQQFPWKGFEGYATSVLSSNYGEYEYLYLMMGERKVVKLSEFYHRNYHDLKAFIATRLSNLGEIPFCFMDETKEIFQPN